MKSTSLPLALLLAAAAGGPLYLAACKKESVPTEQRAPQATPSFCNELFDSAQRAVQAALPKDRSCKANADCTVVDTDACVYACGAAAIPKGGAGVVMAKRTAEATTTCKKYEDADCPRITPRAVASCATPTAQCKDGSCALEPWSPH